MEEKITSDACAGKSAPEQSEDKERKGQAFTELEDLISAEENVEYEEDAAFQAFAGRDALHDWRAVRPAEREHEPVAKGGDKRVSLPLRIRLPNGAAEDYVLNMSVSLHKAEAKEDLGTSRSWGHEEDLEIDLLDGRTTLILEEEETSDDAGEFLHEEPQENWIARIFHAWRARK